jgi:pyrimidine operon attenuation protein/uracil phosphoribosyltransferase
MPNRKNTILMNQDAVGEAISRIANEIAEGGDGPERLALVGIRSRGVPLARRLAKLIGARTGNEIPVGVLDITLYRDDLTAIGSQPLVRATELPFPIDGRRIVLVDDVLFTGRTVRAAIDQLIDFGRPERIELVVLVDRGGRELPIQADYVGRTVPTSKKQTISVKLEEEDGVDEVVLAAEADR